MIVEFRAPVHGYTLEFPTGMAEDTNYEENARRELLEETGYVIDKIVKTPTPILYYDPWKSDENTYLFVA
jgi:8-oxo-dGTP pyrophosphatase MutT (NUDIX family)